jgi:hypothetical protein
MTAFWDLVPLNFILADVSCFHHHAIIAPSSERWL